MGNPTKLVPIALRDAISFRLWSAKQIQSKATFRLWYMKQVWRGERELRLVHSLSDPGRTTLDIGSNRGLYAVAALRFSKRVVAFEPQPRFAAFLRRYLPPTAEVRECAVSDTAGTATLLVPVDPRFHAEARLSAPNSAAPASSNVVPVVVSTVRLDDIIQEPIGLMKIDVEGHELGVLNGASRLIDSWRPNIISEIENRHRPGAVAEAIEWFWARRYRGYCLTDNALSAIGSMGEGQGAQPYNFIFLPAERPPTMRASLLAALSGVLMV
jgi:FkbM family methyltransferase